MTKNEAAIVSAYTGYLIGNFDEMYRYAEKLLNRTIFTHEFGSDELRKELREKAFNDFVTIKIK